MTGGVLVLGGLPPDPLCPPQHTFLSLCSSVHTHLNVILYLFTFVWNYLCFYENRTLLLMYIYYGVDLYFYLILQPYLEGRNYVKGSWLEHTYLHVCVSE